MFAEGFAFCLLHDAECVLFVIVKFLFYYHCFFGYCWQESLPQMPVVGNVSRISGIKITVAVV